MSDKLPVIDVLGTPLAVTSYDELIPHCHELARCGGTWAIDFTNTQIVTMRRHEPPFEVLTRSIDLFVPDGMPLVWAMNAKGAKLSDRVYGPTFMRRFLEESSPRLTHYLLGGSAECQRRLRQRFPRSQIVGGFHGRCDKDGVLEGMAEQDIIEEINRLGPDFIWVGLGAPKQYAWIARHKTDLRRGVILAVGFAFDVNAGTKPDAPAWMQRRGLTWVFRIASEPRRLLTRYLKYNSLFLFYLAKDALAPRRFR
ncbi:MAG: WecB/TagA/CpsF family glycosyltransferase [Chthoniobacterales bacterium]